MDQQTQNMGSGQSSGFLKAMEDFFDTYLHKKVPFHLPPSVKEFIVKFGPWITLILMVLALPVILVAVGLSAFVAPFAMFNAGPRFGAAHISGGLIGLVAFVLQAFALPGLFARSLKGWRLVYYAVLISAIGNLLSSNILGAIIGLVISLYILLEIKEYYK